MAVCHRQERNQDRMTEKITENESEDVIVMTQWALALILFLANMDSVVLQAYDHLVTICYIKATSTLFDQRLHRLFWHPWWFTIGYYFWSYKPNLIPGLSDMNFYLFLLYKFSWSTPQGN